MPLAASNAYESRFSGRGGRLKQFIHLPPTDLILFEAFGRFIELIARANVNVREPFGRQLTAAESGNVCPTIFSTLASFS